MALTPVALLLAYAASVVVDTFLGGRPNAANAGRAILVSSKSLILAGILSGVVGLLRRERYPWLAVLGWASTIGTIGLLIYFDEDG